MLISTKGRYAARMLLDIAEHQGESGYVPMKDVAERQQISKKYMETFTAPLAAAGILDIRRGANGGYRLGKAPKDITLLEILELAEGPIHAVACLECPDNRCPRSPFCATLPVWTGLEKTVSDYLAGITLAQLMSEVKTGLCDEAGLSPL